MGNTFRCKQCKDLFNLDYISITDGGDIYCLDCIDKLISGYEPLKEY